MTLPYRWTPLGADRSVSIERIEQGAIVAHEHAVYRLITKDPKPEDTEFPWRVIIRPIAITGDDPRDRDHDVALKAMPQARFFTFSDLHYPICATCHEPLPCREQMAEEISKKAADEFELYATEGICPACAEPVTPRHKVIMWPENLVVPGGPPVTFHLRRRCWYEAMLYERRWAAADPTRRTKLSCTGSIRCHRDRSYECTQPECPGPDARHPSIEWCSPGYTNCRCVSGHPPDSAETRSTDAGVAADLRRLMDDR